MMAKIVRASIHLESEGPACSIEDVKTVFVELRIDSLKAILYEVV